MNTRADKTQENKSKSITNEVAQNKNSSEAFQFIDNRPKAILQRKLQNMADNYSESVTQKKNNVKQDLEFVNNRSEIANPIQRKISINDSVRAVKEADDDKIKAASADGYGRYYKNETEMTNHLVSKQPVGVGLIKSRALWYRIPPLEAKTFFVFGENHNAITGGDIHAESNIQKPILSEGPAGGTSEGHIQNISDKADTAKASVGLDENGSKLYRAFEIAKLHPIKCFPPPPVPSSSAVASSGGSAIPVPTIADGELTARDVQYGTNKLAVREQDGQATWWKQPDAADPVASVAPQQYQAPVAEAILGLLPLVFKVADLTGPTLEAWTYLSGDNWKQPAIGDRVLRYRLITLQTHIDVLYDLVKAKVITDYATFKDADSVSRKAIADTANADDFRNEYLLAGIKEGAKGNKYSLANIGGNHLKALEPRLSAYPLVKNSELFGSLGKLAIEPPDPYDTWQNLPVPLLSSPPSSYIMNKSGYQKLQEDLQVYRNADKIVREAGVQALLTQSQTLMTRKRATWSVSSDQQKKNRVTQVDALINYLKIGIALKKQCRV